MSTDTSVANKRVVAMNNFEEEEKGDDVVVTADPDVVVPTIDDVVLPETYVVIPSRSK